MHKNILALILVVVAYLFIAKSSHAAVLFEENFNGSSANWSIASGSWNIVDGKYGAYVPNAVQGSVSFANIDIPTPNYSIDLDIFPVKGTDRNVRFRFGGSPGEYDLHFTNDGIATNFGVDNHSVILENHPLVDNHYYHVKVQLNGQHFEVYIDGNKIFDITDPNYYYDGPEKFYLVVATGGVPTEVYFDNIIIQTPDDFLAVPVLKQTDSLWADDIYDSSLLWQSNNGATIGQVGCALTSAAMVFRYHGLTKMPDGNTDLTPKSLNSYLNSVVDANFRNGNTNWQALSKKLSPLLADVNNVNFDKLEFTYRKGQDNTLLDTDLSEGLPVILNVPGHFIVAKGKDVQNNSYHINDPAYDRNSLQSYSNSYINSVTYKPENSDLSYLIFAVDSDVNIHLFDESGQQKGVEVLEEPIDDIEQLSTNLVGPLKVIYFAKPESGNYTLTIDSPSSNTYQLDGYIYDQDDGTKLFTRKSIVGHSNNDTYEISFDKQSVDGSEIINPTVSFETLIADLSDLHLAGNISKKGSYNYISNKIQQAQKYHVSNPQKSESILNDIRQQLIDDKRKGIDVFSNQYLIDQITQLLNN